jgi:maleate isomerase
MGEISRRTRAHQAIAGNNPSHKTMTHHFGVLVPSNNTTIEAELSRLPCGYQAHYARVHTAASGQPFATSKDEDVDYQSRLLATAKVEMVVLVQTTASLVFDDYDAVNTRRIESAGGVPAITSGQALGRALRALGARRICLVSAYTEEVNSRARRYFADKHAVEIAALTGFSSEDAYLSGSVGPEHARAAFARSDRNDIDAFVLPGGNFATMASIAAWEHEFGKPVVTTNQALVWAVGRELGGERIPGFGRLLEAMPA